MDQNKHSTSPTEASVHKWLESRQELLVLYYKLCEMKPKSHNFITEEKLHHFCQYLVDYVSAGHFDVFEKISEAGDGQHLDVSLLVKILKTTNQVLDFSDQYTSTHDYSTLCEALSTIGLSLSQRFDLEDKLIDIYQKVVNNAEKPQIA